MLTTLLEFFTFAFPKAGFSVGNIGLTISLLLFMFFCLIKMRRIAVSLWNIGKDFFLVYCMLAVAFLLIVLKNLFDGTLIPFNIAQLFIIVISPLAIEVPQYISVKKNFMIVSLSSLVVAGYAILQKIFGITSLAIPGLSYTFGASLTDKPIGFSAFSETESDKMPSTYQNGNGMGIFLALSFMFLLAWSPKNIRQKFFKHIGMVLAFTGIILSGSRSILFPLFGILVLLAAIRLIPRKTRLKKSGIVFFIFSFGVFLFAIVPLLFKVGQSFSDTKIYNRYVLQTLSNPSSNRSIVWNDMLAYIGGLDWKEFIGFSIFGTPNGQFRGEGLLALLTEYGLIVTVCFVYLLIRIWWEVCSIEEQHIFSGALLSVVFAFTIDQSFYYPPSVMNYFLISGIVIQYYLNKRKVKLDNYTSSAHQLDMKINNRFLS